MDWGVKASRHQFLNNFGSEMPQDQPVVHRGLLPPANSHPPSADALADARLYHEGTRTEFARYEAIYGLSVKEVLEYSMSLNSTSRGKPWARITD
jgi:hypothetical protein